MPQYLVNPQKPGLFKGADGKDSSASPMPRGPVELGIVFDASGSMNSLREIALAGFNQLLAAQQKLGAPTRFSLSFFANEVQIVHDGTPLSEVKLMEQADYCPCGGTALLDGIGSMIEQIAERTDLSPYPSRVLIAILTDGMENSSVRLTKEEIFEMISFRRTSCDWQFLFMGAGSSQTIHTGLSLGIQRSNIVEFGTTPEGISKVILALSSAVKAYRLGNRNFALLL